LTNELKPKLIIVYGGKVIPKSTLDGFKLPCINVHGSVLPGYRGLDSYWWALIERNQHLMGYSIHFVDQGIDTGNLLGSRVYTSNASFLRKHLSWRKWFAQHSAHDIKEFLKSNDFLNSGEPHLKTQSSYRSRIQFVDLLKLKKTWL
jgi:methionyl-tRNA formyltransferase